MRILKLFLPVVLLLAIIHTQVVAQSLTPLDALRALQDAGIEVEFETVGGRGQCNMKILSDRPLWDILGISREVAEATLNWGAFYSRTGSGRITEQWIRNVPSEWCGGSPPSLPEPVPEEVPVVVPAGQPSEQTETQTGQEPGSWEQPSLPGLEPIHVIVAVVLAALLAAVVLFGRRLRFA